MDWGIFATVAASLSGIFAGAKAYSTVKEGERGVLLTFGKAKRNADGNVKVHQPGGRWILPWIQKMDTLHVQKNTLFFNDLTITLQNNLTYKFSATIIYDVLDDPKWIEHILYRMENKDEFVSVQFMRAVQKVLYKSEELDIKNASARLRKELTPKLEENGWIIDDIDIMLFTETPISQFLRGVDYRIEKALAYKDVLSERILIAALGTNAVITISENDGVNFNLNQEEDYTEEWA